MKNKIFLLVCLNLFAVILFAQKKIVGKVTDHVTEKGIAFVSIVYLKQNLNRGGYTDTLGNFSIEKLDADLQISCIGYQTKIIKSDDLEKSPVIKLLPTLYDLNTVVIRPRKSRIIRLGYFKDDRTLEGPFGFGNYGGKNSERTNYVAQFIKSTKNSKDMIICKLLFNVSNNIKHINDTKLTLSTGCTTNRLRVHLFSIDTETGKPDKELLTKSIVFANDCTKDNIIIDVSDESIYMPVNGVFVALEYVDDLSTSNKSFPYYIVFKERKNNCFYSYHQQNWSRDQYSYKYRIGARFGLELSN